MYAKRIITCFLCFRDEHAPSSRITGGYCVAPVYRTCRPITLDTKTVLAHFSSVPLPCYQPLSLNGNTRQTRSITTSDDLACLLAKDSTPRLTEVVRHLAGTVPQVTYRYRVQQRKTGLCVIAVNYTQELDGYDTDVKAIETLYESFDQIMESSLIQDVFSGEVN